MLAGMSPDSREFITHHAIRLVDEFPDPVQVVSSDGAFLYVNPAWVAQLGYSHEEVQGMTFLDLIHPDHQSAWRNVFKSVLSGQPLPQIEIVLIGKNGNALTVEGSVWSLRTADGRTYAVCAALRNAATRGLREQQVARALYRDEATGLFNPRGFAARSMPLLEVVEENRDRLGAWVVYLDIDNYDQIQRRHGDDAAADAVMRTADILRRALRVHDVIARLTRNAFAALVTLPPKYQANYVTARLRGALQLANRQAGKAWNVELAMGLADVQLDRPLDDAIGRAKDSADQTAGRKFHA
jgi:PAS domain S-box-containing protein/diguanylate cyclase (GGDEF)-like protein